MDKVANRLNKDVYILVLQKLKHMLTAGFYGMDEVRYIYEWSADKSKTANLRLVAEEDAAVRYFLEIGVVNGLRSDNEFQRQQRYGNIANRRLGVWGEEWVKTDDAHREYDYTVHIHGIDVARFTEQCSTFGLENTGLELVNANSVHAPLPKIVQNVSGGFTIHSGDIISYAGRRIDLQAQEGKIAAHVMRRAMQGLYTSVENIADSCLSEAYLEKAGNSGNEALVRNYVWRCMYDIRAAFTGATGASKPHFPHIRGVGYTFAPPQTP